MTLGSVTQPRLRTVVLAVGIADEEIAAAVRAVIAEAGEDPEPRRVVVAPGGAPLP